MASFQNYATLSYQGGTTNSNTVTGELRASLTLTKQAVLATYAAGDRVTYVLSLVNSGTTSSSTAIRRAPAQSATGSGSGGRTMAHSIPRVR